MLVQFLFTVGTLSFFGGIYKIILNIKERNPKGAAAMLIATIGMIGILIYLANGLTHGNTVSKMFTGYLVIIFFGILIISAKSTLENGQKIHHIFLTPQYLLIGISQNRKLQFLMGFFVIMALLTAAVNWVHRPQNASLLHFLRHSLLLNGII